MSKRDKYGMDVDDPTTTVRIPPTCTCQWQPAPSRGLSEMVYCNPNCRLHRVVLRRVTMTVEDGKNV